LIQNQPKEVPDDDDLMPLELDVLEKLYEQEKIRLSELKNRRNFVQQERVRKEYLSLGND